MKDYKLGYQFGYDHKHEVKGCTQIRCYNVKKLDNKKECKCDNGCKCGNDCKCK